MKKKSTLAILGAGPKALAIAAKASVLQKLGFEIPKIIILEKDSVAFNWQASSGFTNGRLPLGTSPLKDVGFPYYSFCWGDVANKRINYLMQRYSWENFLIGKHLYADWIDRGCPAPTHTDWANYLRWVHHHLRNGFEYVQAEVTSLEIKNDKWQISLNKNLPPLEADGVVITGPGTLKLPFEIPEHPRILDYSQFWKQSQVFTQKREWRVGLVGAGENAATIAVTLGQADPSIQVDIISPTATTYTRGESYVENHLYTDPFQGNWLHLTRQDRRDFINRTDRGVFSVTTKRTLDQLRNIEMIPGLFKGVKVDSLDQLLVDIEYNNDRERRIYDHVVLAIGFNHSYFVDNLLTESARKIILEQSGLKEISNSEIENKIDENLALEGVFPSLHLPMLSGLNQGPGFANLSCLGRLSDHILARYVPTGKNAILGEPLVLNLTDAEMNLDET